MPGVPSEEVSHPWPSWHAGNLIAYQPDCSLVARPWMEAVWENQALSELVAQDQPWVCRPWACFPQTLLHLLRVLEQNGLALRKHHVGV